MEASLFTSTAALSSTAALHAGLYTWLVLTTAALLHFAPATKAELRINWLLIALALLSFAFCAAATSLDAGGLGQLFFEIAILLEGVVAIRLTTLLIFRIVLTARGSAAPRIVEDLVTVVACIAFGLVRLRYAGLELSQIVTTSAVITGVIAFSMQDTLGNVLGGLALQLDNSLRLGDWIKLGDINGRVTEIRWRSTSIETRNWETIVVPNSVLMRGEFLVLGRRQGQPRQWRRWVWFNVGYEVAPRTVIEVVSTAIVNADIPNVAADPPPNCLMLDFDRLCGRYALRYWLTDLAVDDPTDSEVRTHIFAALKRHNIDPFVPESFRAIRAQSPQQKQSALIVENERRAAILGGIDLFAALTEAERLELAPQLTLAPFMPGDLMTEQGAVAHWLYIVIEGRAEVVLDEGQRRQSIGWIDAEQPNSYFGEMGLMTGARRSASVIARTEVTCLRLDREAFASIVQSRPELAEYLCGVVAERTSGIEQGAGQLAAAAEIPETEQSQGELLGRIREFFNLD